MYISMCGTGVGFSVESENVQALPQIQKQTGKKLATHVIADSREGWADALALGMKTWYEGNDIDFDFSEIRPAGSRLKTMGGKSSGPDPLRSLLGFTRERILRRQGRRLSNIDAHDIICKIGECVVAGGVRRSAMISLSDLDDEALRDAKKGQFYFTEGQRMLANNSAVYLSKPDTQTFLDEWTALVKSGSGERGIFNRGGLSKTLPERRLKQWGDGVYPSFGTNPCGEIILQSKQFCNLSEVVARAEDTEETLLQKVRVAAMLGTYQSALTYFPYLSREWKKNCEGEGGDS
jgi:ribonucleoside-diphosphate reductase alpha chain